MTAGRHRIFEIVDMADLSALYNLLGCQWKSGSVAYNGQNNGLYRGRGLPLVVNYFRICSVRNR